MPRTGVYPVVYRRIPRASPRRHRILIAHSKHDVVAWGRRQNDNPCRPHNDGMYDLTDLASKQDTPATVRMKSTTPQKVSEVRDGQRARCFAHLPKTEYGSLRYALKLKIFNYSSSRNRCQVKPTQKNGASIAIRLDMYIVTVPNH